MKEEMIWERNKAQTYLNEFNAAYKTRCSSISESRIEPSSSFVVWLWSSVAILASSKLREGVVRVVMMRKERATCEITEDTNRF